MGKGMEGENIWHVRGGGGVQDAVQSSWRRECGEEKWATAWVWARIWRAVYQARVGSFVSNPSAKKKNQKFWSNRKM